jgi:predicted transcriptional regulator
MSNSIEPSRNELLSSLTTIVSSYLSQNPIASEKVPEFIGAVSLALRKAQELTITEPQSMASDGQTSGTGRQEEVSEARASSPTASATPSPWAPNQVISSHATPSEEPLTKPAVPIDQSVTDDYIVCLEDGVRVKVLKRYLGKFKMTPEDYRAKWGLPKNYPMTAAAYSASRADFARSIGLGKKKDGQTAVATTSASVAAQVLQATSPDAVMTPAASARPVADDAAATGVPVKRRRAAKEPTVSTVGKAADSPATPASKPVGKSESIKTRAVSPAPVESKAAISTVASPERAPQRAKAPRATAPVTAIPPVGTASADQVAANAAATSVPPKQGRGAKGATTASSGGKAEKPATKPQGKTTRAKTTRAGLPAPAEVGAAVAEAASPAAGDVPTVAALVVPSDARPDSGVGAVIPPKRRTAVKSAAASASNNAKVARSGGKPASSKPDAASPQGLGKVTKSRQKPAQNTAVKIAKPTSARATSGKATSAPVWVDVKRKPSIGRPKRAKAE